MHQPFFLLRSADQNLKEQQQTKLQLLFFSYLNGPFIASSLEYFSLFRRDSEPYKVLLKDKS